MTKIFLLLLSALFLISCTTHIPESPSTYWEDYRIRLESRPPIIEKGMNELLTLVDYKDNMRGWDLIVFYRMGPTGRWIQAIQDGHTGVYRRAMAVSDPATDVLYVHIKKKLSFEAKKKKEKQKEIIIQFPLSYSTAELSKSGS